MVREFAALQNCCFIGERHQMLRFPLKNPGCSESQKKQGTRTRRFACCTWSGRRDSNSRHSAWEADTLPTELLPRTSPEFSARRKSCQRSSKRVSHGFSDADRLRIPHARRPENADRRATRVRFERHGNARDPIRIVHMQYQAGGQSTGIVGTL